MDGSLKDTIYSLMTKTKNIDKLYISVFSQDYDDQHPKLESLFDFFNFNNYFYQKISYKDARGVGYARHEAQKFLDDKYEYFLQVDSHTIFIDGWDEKLINDYNRLEPEWGGKIIFSTYPQGYYYNDDGNFLYSTTTHAAALKIISEEHNFPPFNSKYTDYIGEEYGFWSGFFCGGFAFGRAKYFLEVPPDPDILFWGEEHVMSVKMYDKDIKIICPPYNYLYHDYDGRHRKRIWEKTENWENLKTKSDQRLHDFFLDSGKDEYTTYDPEKYRIWKICFVRDE